MLCVKAVNCRWDIDFSLKNQKILFLIEAPDKYIIGDNQLY